MTGTIEGLDTGLTGTFEGLDTRLTDKIEGLDTNVTALDGKVTALGTRVMSLEGKFDVTGRDVSDIRERLARVEGHLMAPEGFRMRGPEPPSVGDAPPTDPGIDRRAAG